MINILSEAQQQKILTPAVHRIMDALRTSGGEARVVGGAVRDVIMERSAGDIDLAANLPPQRVIEILTKAHIKTVPTGIAHGTITAVVDHVGFEITTLRHDIETDGRHAQVAFTDDWQADAARRDFTFNALYADSTGALYDYFGGIEDARTRRVRFIGDAQARIREDVLRILRFFRFFAWFGNSHPDADALIACRALAGLIPRLSAERIAHETLKLLAAHDPVHAWHLMIDGGITAHFLAEATHIETLKLLLKNETTYGITADPLLRLTALLSCDTLLAQKIAARLKLSNRDGDILGTLAAMPPTLHGSLGAQALRRTLYKFGARHTGAALLLLDEKIDSARDIVAAWENPVFPIKGEDIVAAGIPAGPRVGGILRAVEGWWVDGDFRADRAACLMQIESHGKNH